MPDQPQYPHQLLEMYLADLLGRRADLYGEFAEQLFIPLVRGVCDQLSIYLDQRPMAALSIGTPRLREGDERSYVFVPIRDRGGPLELRVATTTWNLDTNNSWTDLARTVVGRRWRFVNRELSRVVLPLLRGVADTMTEYYARRPYAQPKAGIIRVCEDVAETVLVVEIDDRSEVQPKETQGRYRVR